MPIGLLNGIDNQGLKTELIVLGVSPPDYLVVHFGVILLDYASRTSGLDKASGASQKFYRHNGMFSSELLLGVQISEFNDD